VVVMLNRSALIVRYKQPFVDWINSIDSGPESEVSLEEGNEENNVYLIEVEDEEELDEWLDLHSEELFEDELYSWYTDPSLWPEDRSTELFRAWCAFELYTMVYDTGSTPLEDDET
jgi:hypothetical protein